MASQSEEMNLAQQVQESKPDEGQGNGEWTQTDAKEP
jgi:hypothetical protein